MKKAIILTLAFLPLFNFGQYCDSFALDLEDELDLGCTKNTLTVLHDQMGRDYLYASNAEAGLTVVNASDPENLAVALTIGPSDFNGLNVNSIVQQGNYLYVALGKIFSPADEPSGLAIVNVTNPLSPVVEDVWQSDENGGAASVTVRGHLAYLCGLENGVFVLNVGEVSDITMLSQFVPSKEWPESTDEAKINARNIAFDGETGYLAYDAGGLRILDVSNPSALEEIGRYSNPAFDGAARAYNNLLKDGDLVYIAVDYGGMEVLNVSNPDDVTLTGWWNPNELPLENPAATSARWFSSRWHTNEIHLIKECGLIMMSTGRTEIVGVDVSVPSSPELCGQFGDGEDDLSSYGMTVYNDRVYVGMICTFGIPFPGTWAGIKSLEYDSDCPLGIAEEDFTNQLQIYPNPAQHQFTIESEANVIESVTVFNISGQQVLQDLSGSNVIAIDDLDPGMYLLHIKTDQSTSDLKLIVE